jgi:transcriptional antiterminator
MTKPLIWLEFSKRKAMYKIKEIAEILNVSDRTVERYLKSYITIEKGAYRVSDKMLDVLKKDYTQDSSDTIVEEFTKDDYMEFHKRLVEYPFLKERAETLLKDMEYHRKSMESKERQMELLLRTIEQKNFLEAKEKGFDN